MLLIRRTFDPFAISAMVLERPEISSFAVKLPYSKYSFVNVANQMNFSPNDSGKTPNVMISRRKARFQLVVRGESFWNVGYYRLPQFPFLTAILQRPLSSSFCVVKICLAYYSKEVKMLTQESRADGGLVCQLASEDYTFTKSVENGPVEN